MSHFITNNEKIQEGKIQSYELWTWGLMKIGKKLYRPYTDEIKNRHFIHVKKHKQLKIPSFLGKVTKTQWGKLQ